MDRSFYKIIRNTKHILALHFGALGDFILSWPGLGLLMSEFPCSNLHLIGNSVWGKLILPSKQVHDREAAWVSKLFLIDQAPEIDDWLKNFALAVVFASRPNISLLAHLYLAGIKKIWTVPTQPEPNQCLHVSDLQVLALKAYGLSGQALSPLLQLEWSHQKGLPVIMPGSGGFFKRLNPELVACAARQLAGTFTSLLLLLGPAESYEYNSAWRKALDEVLVNISYQCLDCVPLSTVVQVLIAAPVYLGADSGITHLSAALGVPTLAIFQASDSRIWAPRGSRVRICNTRNWQSALSLLLEIS